VKKTFTIHSKNSVVVNRQKLVSEIKTPVLLALGKSPDTFLESFKNRMRQYYTGYDIIYGKVSKHNFKIHHFVEGRRSLSAYGKLEEGSTGTIVHVTLDMTFDLIVGFFSPIVVICFICIRYGDPGYSYTLGFGTNQILFILSMVAFASFIFSKHVKIFQDELKFYRARLIKIFE
jgi:hypothetical protein